MAKVSPFFLSVCALSAVSSLCAAEPGSSFLKRNDVIALVGGEDMVSAAECGYLEFFLVRALPDYHLRFRSLAWEGDSLFEQRRDLNYPTLEQQLDSIKATAVIVQVGKMEAVQKVTQGRTRDDSGALNALLTRCGHTDKEDARRLALIAPAPFEASPYVAPSVVDEQNAALAKIGSAFAQASQERHCWSFSLLNSFNAHQLHGFTRDGVHLNDRGQAVAARLITADFLQRPEGKRGDGSQTLAQARFEAPPITTPRDRELLALIQEKNRLWFHYYRPQNWAFLAGDRTNQPSSRDWRDPSKRWFPAEMEEFLPLIQKKEVEIDKVAAELAKGGNDVSK